MYDHEPLGACACMTMSLWVYVHAQALRKATRSVRDHPLRIVTVEELQKLSYVGQLTAKVCVVGWVWVNEHVLVCARARVCVCVCACVCVCVPGRGRKGGGGGAS